MHSDESIKTVFKTQEFLENTAIDTRDEFVDSQPSFKTNFSKPPFNPIISSVPVIKLSSNLGSFYTDATQILSTFSSFHPDTPSPMTDDQLEHDLNHYIQHQPKNNLLFNHLQSTN